MFGRFNFVCVCGALTLPNVESIEIVRIIGIIERLDSERTRRGKYTKFIECRLSAVKGAYMFDRKCEEKIPVKSCSPPLFLIQYAYKSRYRYRFSTQLGSITVQLKTKTQKY